MENRRFKVRGRRWKIKFVGSWDEDEVGDCLHYRREIRIDQTQSDQDMLGTIIHEVTHAAFPDLNEEAVIEYENALAGLLWRLGYRRT